VTLLPIPEGVTVTAELCILHFFQILMEESTTTFATARVCRAALATSFSSNRFRRDLLRGLRIGLRGGGAFLDRITKAFFRGTPRGTPLGPWDPLFLGLGTPFGVEYATTLRRPITLSAAPELVRKCWARAGMSA